MSHLRPITPATFTALLIILASETSEEAYTINIASVGALIRRGYVHAIGGTTRLLVTVAGIQYLRTVDMTRAL